MDAPESTDSLRPFDLLQDRPGFDTTALRLRVNGGEPDAAATPRAASARSYLRARMPAIYQEHEFGRRFLGAFEMVLDPIVGLLDSEHAHFDPELAPRDVLGLMAAWLGVGLDEAWPEERWRELVREAAALGRLRGTRAGLERELRIAFPGVPLRVDEQGAGVVWGADAESPPARKRTAFVVYCDKPLSEPDAAAVARAIELLKPVNVPYRLRIRTTGSAGR